MKTDYSGTKLDLEFMLDLQKDLESAATDLGFEMKRLEDGDDADTIVSKANGNTKAHNAFQAASERMEQALKVLFKQQN